MKSPKIEGLRIESELGVGKYGRVFRALDLRHSRVVAVKEIKIENEDEGIPITTLREIMLLKGIKHRNVVELIDTVVDIDRNLISLVLEFMDSDLAKILSRPGGLPKLQQKVGSPEDHVRRPERGVVHPLL